MGMINDFRSRDSGQLPVSDSSFQNLPIKEPYSRPPCHSIVKKSKMNRCNNCNISCERALCRLCNVRRLCHRCGRRLDSRCFDDDRVDIFSVSPHFINRELPRLVSPQMQAAKRYEIIDRNILTFMSLVGQTIIV